MTSLASQKHPFRGLELSRSHISCALYNVDLWVLQQNQRSIHISRCVFIYHSQRYESWLILTILSLKPAHNAGLKERGVSSQILGSLSIVLLRSNRTPLIHFRWLLDQHCYCETVAVLFCSRHAPEAGS